MSLGLLLIILNYYSHSLLGKKEYDVKFSRALCRSTTSYSLKASFKVVYITKVHNTARKNIHKDYESKHREIL